ncbi:hemicentin-1-like [Anoplopoma fimbria]|uniref:hemicentin-1-like n=1 Tax=Anoplopoma fimbria TaxID=229290 RepID=UPI0023EAB42A|nr:hemicentin-1-like [Anoplopoma fimbria]
MSSTAAASGFVVFLLSVQVIQSEDGWGVTYTPTEVCAVEGSTVEIHCTYTYPSRIQHRDIKEAFWFKQKGGEPVDLRTDSEYSGRVQYRCYEKKCTLIIKNVRESDSAEYKFRFGTNKQYEKYTGSPGVFLSFTGLQVKVSRYELNRPWLKCHSSCGLPDNPSYIWYKNGQHIKAESSSYHSVDFGSADSYSCAVRGSENHRSPPVSTYTWYKRNGYLSSRPLSEEPQLVFSSIQSSDSGQYYCTAENQLGTKTSEHISINVTSNYTWYKKDVNPDPPPLSKEPQLVFSSIQSSDSGQYNCTAENQLGTKTSEHISINVTYAPKLPSVSVSPSDEIVEGSSVNLTCSSDANPAANYTWYKEGEDSPKASGQIFTITDFRAEHSGNYYCEAQNNRGRSNSTFHLITVAVSQGSMTTVAVGSTVAILLAIIILAAFLLIRRKRSSTQTSEPGERPDNDAQSATAEQQEELCYASVSFSRNQEEVLYSNVSSARPHRRKEEEEDVEYTSVKFKSASATNESRGQGAVDDLSALYSKVSKQPRV